MRFASPPPITPAPKTPAEKSPEFPPADLDSIGQDFLDNVPEAEPDFVAKLQQEVADEIGASESYQNGAPAPAEPEIIRDKTGKIFDPKFCKVDDNGNPIYTKTGLFDLKDRVDGVRVSRNMLKKQIRVPKQPKPPEINEPAGQVGAAAAVPPPPDDAQITAETIDGLYWAGMGFFGAEKIPQVSAAGVDAMTSGFRQMDNPPKVPWWVGVAAIYGSATAAILNRKEAKPKLQSLKEKLGLAWLKFRGRRPKPAEA